MCYGYIHLWDKFSEKLVQSKECFFSGLNNKGITDKHYKHK